MTQSSFPFENIDTTETQFSQWARHIGQGVTFDENGDRLEVTAGAGLSVDVDPGRAMVRGHFYTSTATENLPLTTADASNPRIDTVVLELDPAANSILLKVVDGTPAASPTGPTLTRTDAGVYQVPLANVQVNAGSGVPNIITDRRRDLVRDTLEELEDVNLTTPVSGDSLVYDGTDWVNGPRSGNAIINGDFGIWQRGTSFTASGYTADRWDLTEAGYAITLTREDLTPGDIEAIGYGAGEYFMRLSTTGTASSANILETKLEDVGTFAGQSVTLSFWVKASSAVTLTSRIIQNFGSGGSAANVVASENYNVTTSWSRVSIAYDIDSITGKTVGTGSYLDVLLFREAGGSSTLDGVDLDFWGVQLEAGPVATPFKLAGGGSKAAELALCQRYYCVVAEGIQQGLGAGYAITATLPRTVVQLPVTMRATPSLDHTTGTDYYTFGSSPSDSGSALSLAGLYASPQTLGLNGDTDFSGLTPGYGGLLRTSDAAAYVAADAELQ